MNPAGLTFPAPRCGEARELNALLARRADLANRVREAEHAGTHVSQQRMAASAAVQAVERRRASGESVPDAEVKRATKALEAAKAREAEPWPERVAGMREAMRAMDQDLAAFVVGHFDALADEIAGDGQAATARVDDAARELIAAHAARQAVERRVFALAGVVRNPRPGDVRRSRADAVAREAGALLQRGGEDAPTLLSDPRQPRSGQAVAAGFSPGDVDPWS
jgi:hypothetical protein